jgi:competence protein ComEC
MRFREPLLIPLAAFALGILASRATDLTRTDLTLGLSGTVLLALVGFVLHANRAAYIAILAATLFTGAAADVYHRPPPPPRLDAEDGELLMLSGCVVEPSAFSPDREQFTLELEPGARARATLAIKPGDSPPTLEYGQRVKFAAMVRRPHNFGNPGAFDYERYLARQDIYWTASARSGTPIQIEAGACGSRISAVISRIRVAALRRIEELYPRDLYSQAMMKAILLGDSTNLERVWTDHFRRTGTFHALVISGLHIIVLAGTLLYILRFCMIPESIAAFIAGIGAWLYAAVSGNSAPAVRAAAGFTLYLIGRYMYRRGRVLNLLSAVALVYLACDPGQLLEPSFQLSFLSVAAIGAFADPVTRIALARYSDAGRGLGEARKDMRIAPRAAEFRVELRLLVETVHFLTHIPIKPLTRIAELLIRGSCAVAGAMILSAVVQIALALPMAVYFHRISITGLTANLLVVPCMNMLVPVGFIAIFFRLPFAARVARLLLDISQYVATWHVRWEPGHRIPDPPLWLALALVAALAIAGIALRRANRWRWVAAAGALALFALMLIAPFQPDLTRGRLELTAVDVGQGEALMVTTPRGRVMLIDAGGIPAFGRARKPRLEIGEDVVSPYLWRRRIQHVDVIATTHAHEDHVGGLRALIENYHPTEIWTGALPERSVETGPLTEARNMGIRIRRRTAGEQLEFGGIRIEILTPSPDYQPREEAHNNDSLGMRLVYGEHSFLLLGDMERDIEWGLMDRGALHKTTVLKAAHHGSKTSSTPELLDATRPDFAVISAGYGNLFGHPNRDVLDRLAQHHTGILRTDQDGLVSISTDGHRIRVDKNSWQKREGASVSLRPVW